MQDAQDMMDVVAAEQRNVKSYLQDMGVEPAADIRGHRDQLLHVMEQRGHESMNLLVNYMTRDCTSVNDLARKYAERIFEDSRVAVGRKTLLGSELLRAKETLRQANLYSDQTFYRDIIDYMADAEAAMAVVKMVSEHIKRVELRELEAARVVRLLDLFRRKYNQTISTAYTSAAPPENLVEPLRKLVANGHDDVSLLLAIEAMDNATKEQIVTDIFGQDATDDDDDQARLDLQVFRLVTDSVAAAAAQPNPFSLIK